MGRTPTVDIISILNNLDARAKLTNFIDEALIVKRSIQNKNDDLKAIREAATEKLGIEPKMFSQLVGLYFKGNFDEKQAELSELESAIELLTGQSFGSPDVKARFDQSDIDE